MKWLITGWLVLVVPLVHAVECGPLIQESKVKALEKSLTDALSKLRQHEEVLINENKRLLAGAFSEVSEKDFQKTTLEIDRVSLSHIVGEQVESRLDATSMQVVIRDLMVDKQDRLIVEKYLSLYAAQLKRISEINYRYISKTLTQVSRPGVAIDVSKLRDVLGTVLGEFQRYEAPKPPSKRAPTVQ